MPAFVCPNCNREYMLPDHIGDFVCDCKDTLNAGSAVRFDDVKVKGNWDDYSGSDSNVPPHVTATQGRSNVVGQRGKIEGEFVPPLTDKGNNKEVMRQRGHQEYIES